MTPVVLTFIGIAGFGAAVAAGTTGGMATALVLAGSSDLSAAACAETGRSEDPDYRAGWRRGVRRASDAWEARQ